MATEEDRSLHASMSLPMWMRGRGRMHNTLDFDQNTFSPPENDDSFLCIRYPVKQPPSAQQDSQILVNDQGAIKLDITKHTEPCKDYILGKTNPSKAQVVNGSSNLLKSAGTDDGFKSPEASACGTSVIRVASQMVSSKVVKGFETFEDEEQEHMRAIGFDPHLRRGSRSLPASPLQSPNASPKSKRKHGNKYFTNASAYVDDKKPGSILANLLAKRDFSRSVTSIAEEQVSQLADSSSMSRLPFIHADVGSPSAAEKKATAKAKLSHLREMNFWSPTSM